MLNIIGVIALSPPLLSILNHFTSLLHSSQISGMSSSERDQRTLCYIEENTFINIVRDIFTELSLLRLQVKRRQKAYSSVVRFK